MSHDHAPIELTLLKADDVAASLPALGELLHACVQGLSLIHI